MIRKYISRWLQGVQAGQGDACEPASAAVTSPSVLQVDAQQLAEDREAVAQLQHDTFRRIRLMQGEMQGLATRHALARVSGLPAEKSALVRIFAGLKTQLAKAEQFHADLMSHQQLLENLATTREFAVLRQRLHEGVLAGRGFGELRRMLDASLTAELQERAQTTELLHEWARHDEDVSLQNQACLVAAEDELTALSEGEYQVRAQAQVQPLEAMADRVDLRLRQKEAGLAMPEGSLTPTSRLGGK